MGNDSNSGKSIEQAFQSLAKVKSLSLQAGDIIYLASGEIFKGTLNLVNVTGKANLPIIIDSYPWNTENNGAKAVIDAQGFNNCVLIENSSFIQVKNLSLSANGPGQLEKIGEMRVGVFINNTTLKKNEGIILENLSINDIFFEPKGTIRNADEVKSANGTQKYGWGIRLICTNPKVQWKISKY